MTGLQVMDITFSYGKRKVLENAGFLAERGELCTLLGPNGAGKSTLLKCINGLLTPGSGKVLWNGKETGKLTFRQRAEIYGYVPQSLESSSELTVMETVLSGRIPHGGLKAGTADVEKAGEILEELGLSSFAFQRLKTLSGGERQRVFIGRALAQDPEVLLLDEPTSSLDLRYQYEVMEMLKEMGREKKLAVVAVIHDLNLALDFADRVVLISGSKVKAQGKPKEILTPERIEEAYGIPVEMGQWGSRLAVLPQVRGSFQPEKEESLIP